MKIPMYSLCVYVYVLNYWQIVKLLLVVKGAGFLVFGCKTQKLFTKENFRLSKLMVTFLIRKARDIKRVLQSLEGLQKQQPPTAAIYRGMVLVTTRILFK